MPEKIITLDDLLNVLMAIKKARTGNVEVRIACDSKLEDVRAIAGVSFDNTEMVLFPLELK